MGGGGQKEARCGCGAVKFSRLSHCGRGSRTIDGRVQYVSLNFYLHTIQLRDARTQPVQYATAKERESRRAEMDNKIWPGEHRLALAPVLLCALILG